MIKDFEEYLSFIESQLEIQLYDWQKMFLRGIYDNSPVCQYGHRSGKVMLYKTAQMLKEEMERDKGNLPPRLYELDKGKGELTMGTINYKADGYGATISNPTFEICADSTNTKSHLKIGNMVIHNTHRFNWFHRKMWKLLLGFDVENVKEKSS